MAELEDVGWKKAAEKTADQVTDLDFKSIFNLVDIDKSGTVSRTVSPVLIFSLFSCLLQFSPNSLPYSALTCLIISSSVQCAAAAAATDDRFQRGRPVQAAAVAMLC